MAANLERGLALGCSGSLLVEAIVGISLVSAALMLNLEWIRRSYYEMAVHHAAFVAVRTAVLAPDQSPKQRVAEFWGRALGDRAALDWQRRAEVGVLAYSSLLVGRVHISFPSWLRFKLENGIKNTFEVTRRCRFALSP